MNLFQILKGELYKIFSRPSLWIGVALLFGLILVCFSPFNVTGDYGNINDFYQNDFKQYEGTLSQKSLTFIASNPNATTTLSALERSRNSIIYFAILDAQTRQKTLDEIASFLNATDTGNCAYRNVFLKNQMLRQLEMPKIYFTLPWRNVLSSGVYFILILLILLGVAPIFCEEYTTHMDSILLCTRHGRRRLITAKLLAVALFSLVSCVCLMLFYSMYHLTVLGTIGWNAPLQSMWEFVNSPYHLTILQYYFVMLGILAAGSIFFAVFIMLLSMVTRNTLIPFFIGIFLYMFPTLMSQGSVPAWLNTVFQFDYSKLLEVNGLFSQFKTYNLFGYPVLYLDLILTIYTILTTIWVVLSYLVFEKRQVKSNS